MKTGGSEARSRLDIIIRLCLSFALASLVPMVIASQVEAVGIRVAAPPTTIELMLEPLKTPFEKATGITVSIQNLDGRDALPLLKRGELDMVATSQTAEVYLREAAAHGVTPDPGALRSFVVRRIPLAIIAHPASPFTALNKEQLRGIFSGSTRNWEEVGGADDPIDVLLYDGYRPDAPIKHAFLEKEEVYPEAQRLETPVAVRVAIASSPAGIGVIPAGMLDGSVKKLETPDIAHLPAFMTHGEPSAVARKFIDFAQGEGQKYLEIPPAP